MKTTNEEEMIELYKVLLEQTNTNQTTFITALLGIVVLLVGATWWWNKIGANRFIKESVKNELKNKTEEIEKIINDIVEKSTKEKFDFFENKMSVAEFEIYRSFAVNIQSQKIYSHSILYWAKAIERAIIINEGKLLRAITDEIIKDIDKLDKKKIHSSKYVKEVIEKLPSTLDREKQNILKKIKAHKD